MNSEEPILKKKSLNEIVSDKKTEEETSLSKKEKQLVVFNLAKEEYAIEIHNTREIIEKPEITKIPNSPGFIAGLINIRGKIIPIIDLGEKFNLTNTEGKQILVTEIKEEQFGLLIDEVIEITKVKEKLIKNAPSILAEKIHLDYITGVAVLEKRIIIIINIENLLDEKDLKKSLEQSKKIKQTIPKETEKKEAVKKENAPNKKEEKEGIQTEQKKNEIDSKPETKQEEPIAETPEKEPIAEPQKSISQEQDTQEQDPIKPTLAETPEKTTTEIAIDKSSTPIK